MLDCEKGFEMKYSKSSVVRTAAEEAGSQVDMYAYDAGGMCMMCVC